MRVENDGGMTTSIIWDFWGPPAWGNFWISQIHQGWPVRGPPVKLQKRHMAIFFVQIALLICLRAFFSTKLLMVELSSGPQIGLQISWKKSPGGIKGVIDNPPVKRFLFRSRVPFLFLDQTNRCIPICTAMSCMPWVPWLPYIFFSRNEVALWWRSRMWILIRNGCTIGSSKCMIGKYYMIFFAYFGYINALFISFFWGDTHFLNQHTFPPSNFQAFAAFHKERSMARKVWSVDSLKVYLWIGSKDLLSLGVLLGFSVVGWSATWDRNP